MKENSILGDTGGIGSVTSNCNDIMGHTKGKCQAFKDKTLVLMSHVGYSGLCLYDLEEKVIFNSINKIPLCCIFLSVSNKDSNVIISS